MFVVVIFQGFSKLFEFLETHFVDGKAGDVNILIIQVKPLKIEYKVVFTPSDFDDG